MSDVAATPLSAEDLLAALGNEAVEKHLRELIGKTVLRDVFGRVTDSVNIDRLAWLSAGITSSEFVVAEMPKAQKFATSVDLLRAAVAETTIDGLYLEFGVRTGRTINLIAQAQPKKTIYGFDSFEGLPEDWRRGFDAGKFARPDLPRVLGNVELVVGWFDRTLPTFLDRFPEQPVAFLHVDCDLYSSTQTLFAQLKTRLKPGTIIVFDEYLNFPGWQQHEHKAFMEFCSHTGVRYKWLGYVPSHQQTYARIVG